MFLHPLQSEIKQYYYKPKIGAKLIQSNKYAFNCSYEMISQSSILSLIISTWLLKHFARHALAVGNQLAADL